MITFDVPERVKLTYLVVILQNIFSGLESSSVVSVFYINKPSITSQIETSTNNGILRNTTAVSTIACGIQCASEASCYSYITDNESTLCQVFDRIQRKLESPTVLTGALYFEKWTSPCPSNFISTGGRCIKYFGTKVTWNVAQTTCQQHGAYLFHASTLERHTFLVQSFNVNEGHHIGGFKENGQWIWPDGNLLSSGYQSWGTPAPSGDCLQIFIKPLPAPSEWLNFDCNGPKLDYLCEIIL